MKNIIYEATKNICKECNKKKKYPVEENSRRFFCDICWKDTLVFKIKNNYE